MKKEYLLLEMELFFMEQQDIVTASDSQGDNDLGGDDMFD